MKTRIAAGLLALAGTAQAQEPDNLVLPPGFHAQIVAEGLGPLRHLAVRPNGDIYASTGGEGAKGEGLVAIRLGPDGKAAQVEHFSAVNGGTGIGLYHGMLYAASGDAIYRFHFDGQALVPVDQETVVSGLPRPGNHPFAFDDSGHLFVSLGAKSDACSSRPAPGAPPVGQKPCPDLTDGSGIWRFAAGRTGQAFTDGEQVATGIRFVTAMNWSPRTGLYAIMHGRDGTHGAFPDLVSAAEDDAIADEMHHVVKGTDFGWPYTYYDGARKIRLLAPDYGGDGRTAAADGLYSTPAVSFQPMRAAPVDLLFYQGRQFPAEWRGGAFIALHGTGGPPLAQGRNGYTVAFVPFDRSGKAGALRIFADGFAGPSPADKNSGKARYRPVGLAVAPDGALYVADSNKGRLWRIHYDG